MDNEKILEQINKLLQKTKEKKIDWKSSNINIIRWVKEENGRIFTTTLQSQQMASIVLPGVPMQPNVNYFLTIQVTNPLEVILQINTLSVNSPFKESLARLFNEALSVSKNTSTETLNKLLENL